MLCRHCGKKISLLRRLNDAEFCSDRHRADFLQLEREAALVRLTESGARIIPPEPVPARKGSKKQAKSKDEIPAPLAGLLREPERKPKAKRRVFGHVRMMGWTLIQELPQAALATQARRMDFAGGVPLEAHPARPATLIQITPAQPAQQPVEQTGSGLPPFAELAELSFAAPARGFTGWRVGLAVWTPSEPGTLSLPCLTAPGPEVAPCWPDLATAVALAVPAPVRIAAAMPGIFVEPGLEAHSPSVETRLAMPAAGGRALNTERGESSSDAPLSGIDVLAGIELAGLLPIALISRPLPRPEPLSRVGAVGARRRLVGPRVRRAINPALGFSLAPQAVLATGRPVNAGPAKTRQAVAGTLQVGTAEPRLPGWRRDFEAAPAPLAIPSAGLCALGPLRTASWGAAIASPAAEAAWAEPEPLRPRPILAIEGELMAPAAIAISVNVLDQPAIADPVIAVTLVTAVTVDGSEPAEAVAGGEAVEAVAASSEVESAAAGGANSALPGGPPMLDRQFPLFASRGLKSQDARSIEPAEMTSLWIGQLSRPPSIRPLRLIPDHADGSGSRVTEIAPPEPSKPWLSIHLPSLPVASWRAAPADLKWITLALPAILLLALYSFLPSRTKNSVEAASSGSGQPTALSQRFETIRTAIMERAAVKMADDFRAGLGAWQGTSGWAQSWTYTDASFVSPGQLALYKPSLGMRDYVFAFLGQIDRRSLNWVVRARDENNYLAMRIVMTRSGPMPAASLIRYTVLDGKMDRQTTLPLPVAFRDGTMQQVEVTVAGDTITTRVMGQVVDSFSDDRLAAGGVGFYSPKGDRSLLRWISITHQYDYIGRLCALLAPYHVSQEARRME